jgi:S-adenosylmethionine:tRNA ribosyltransferase-isomerase
MVEDHPMHAEWCSMSDTAAAQIRSARASGGRVFAVGTTAARTLESYAHVLDVAGACPGPMETRILITPGHTWRWVDGILTNFHLPRSTLLAMVGALFPGGVDEVKSIYAEAIAQGYRFYSFGDAMLVLP